MKKMHFIHLLRVHHWIKNLILFSGLIFYKKIFIAEFLTKTFLTFISFCLLSSVIYILNDCFDQQRDRNHPDKKNRPIASGKVSKIKAYMIAIFLGVTSLSLVFFIKVPNIFLIWFLYVILMIFYSWFLKNLVWVDVITISLGFVLRLYAGCQTVDRFPPLSWSFCAFSLAFFLGLAKRRCELLTLKDGLGHRKVLAKYSLNLLDLFIFLSSLTVLITYLIFISIIFHEDYFFISFLTFPFVFLGILRYYYILYGKKLGSYPDQIIIQDKYIILYSILWISLSIISIYN